MRCTQEGEQERDKREEGKQEGVEHEARSRLPTSAHAAACQPRAPPPAPLPSLPLKPAATVCAQTLRRALCSGS